MAIYRNRGTYKYHRSRGLSPAFYAALQAWWTLDELSGTRADATAKITPLTDNNTVLAGGGVGSYALALNGTSQFLSVADPFAPPTAFTISVWIYPTTVAAGTHIIAAQGKGSDGTTAFGLYLNGATPTFNFSANGTTIMAAAATSGNVAVNQWYLITARWDGTTLTLYTNTTAGTGQAVSGTVFNSTAAMTVGAHGTVASNFFGGRIQNLAIWNNTDKGASIVSDLYAAGRGLRYEQLTAAQKVGMFDFWPLGEALGNRVGSFAGTALAPTDAPGRLAGRVQDANTSNSAQFVAGNNESLSHASDAALQTGDIDWALGGWFNLDALPGATALSLLSKGDASNNEYDVTIRTSAASNTAQFNIYDGAANVVGTVETTATAPTAGTSAYVSAWHDAALSKTYIQMNNGTVFEAADSGVPAVAATAFYLGTLFGSTSADISGTMNEWWLTKGYYPNSAERAYLYNSGAGRTYSNGEVV